jgi:protoheme IX farnesyltransferase
MRLQIHSFFSGSSLRRGIALLVIALSYVFAVVAGVTTTLTGAVVSATAIAALGLVISSYVSARVGPTAQPLLGGRAQKARRNYRMLALGSAAVLYSTLVGGVLVRNAGALWVCPTLVCSATSDLAILAMVHRGVAALAMLLIALLVWRTWRLFSQPVVRLAAGAALGLMLVQIVVGMTQVWLLHDSATSLAATRLAHLALGAGAWAALVIGVTAALRLPFPKQADKEQARQGAGEAHNVTDSSAVRRPLSVVRDYVSLTKPGVITLLIFTTFAAMFITPAGLPSFSLVFWTMLAGWLMPAGAHALNCYFDRDIDIRMGRTGRRPLPSNRIPAWHALVLGLSLMAVSFVLFVAFVNWAAALLAFAGFFYYVVIYTLWLKRSTMSNIVIGGAAGAFPPLIGWAAVTGGLTLPSLFLFLIIFYWTPPHFWALALIRQKDYANAGVPMLPVVAGDDETRRQIVLYSVQMIMLTLLLTPFGVLGLPYMVMALGLGGLFLRLAVRLYRVGTTAAAWSLYKFSLLYLFLLFVAMMVDRLLA